MLRALYMKHACAVYISSGLSSVAQRVAAAASAIPRAAVVDTFTDEAYARSSVKIVAEPEALLAAAQAATIQALSIVDLSQEPHPAPHPRQGAVDMVSFMPLSERSGAAICLELEECDELAWQLGRSLDGHCPVLMYGRRAARTLVETRRGTSFFRSTKAQSAREATAELPLDFGAAVLNASADSTAAAGTGGSHSPALASVLPQRSGVAIIGAQPYVTNFNICVARASLADCKAAERLVRSQFGVQVMALPHAGETHEIGCNLQASEEADSPDHDAVLAAVAGCLPEGASVERSYVIGLTPAQAVEIAEEALKSEN